MVDGAPGPSRRGFLTAAGTALAGGALAACGSSSTPASRLATATTPNGEAAHADLAILQAALVLERRAVTAYAAAIPLLDARQAVWGKRFLSEELQHTGELISLIKVAGGTAPPRAESYPIGHAHDGPSALAVLNSLEALQISSYLRWIPRLSPGTMRAAVASILSSDAQHIAALRQARGRPATPTAFVTGVQ